MLTAGACPSCQFRAILTGLSKTKPQLLQPWQSHRSMTTQKRIGRDARGKASRMTLSRDVARPSRPSEFNRPRLGPSPFGGMNQTVARVKPREEKSSPVAVKTGGREARTSASGDHTKTRRATGEGKPEKPLFHALKMQATLTPLNYRQRTAVKEKLDQIEYFEQFGLLPEVQKAIYSQALEGMTEVTPTPAQKLAIPAMLGRKNAHIPRKRKPDDETTSYEQFLIAAETGSGKTLAYLLPVIDAIKRQEVVDDAEEKTRTAKVEKERAERQKSNVFEVDPPELSNPPHLTQGRPRALILLPSSELVTQVGGVIKKLAHAIKYRSAPISAIHTAQRIRNRLYDPKGIDITISTPHLISSIAQKDPYILSRVSHLVIDEADSLLDRSFAATTSSVIDRAAPSLKQLVLCSATIPRSLDTFLDKRFPNIKRLVTPKLHSINRRVQLGVIDIEKDPYRGNRNLACAEVIWTIGKSEHEDTHATRTLKCMLVFVNEREKAEEVARFLAAKGIDAVALTRDTTEQRQSEVLNTFTSPQRVDGTAKSTEKAMYLDSFIPFDQSSSNSVARGIDGLTNPSPPRPTRILKDTKVLVTTDLGSRGIDTLAVRHVILYDVPHNTIDFVHRLGRVGRMGRRGRAIVLTGKHDRKDVVAEVREAMFRGQALI